MGFRLRSAQRTASVGTSLQLVTGGIVAVALMLTLGIGYFTTVDSMRSESLHALRLLIESRARGESTPFLLAEENVQRLETKLLEMLDETPAEAAEAAFHQLFQQSDDGIWRVRPERSDFRRFPTLYLQKNANISPSVCQRAVASYRLLAERGPALAPPFYSVYMDFVERGLMVYSPHVDWGANATLETDNFNYPTMIGSMPENNPAREKFWTPVYLDGEAGVWMVSVIEPLDWAGEWVGTVGHDVAIDAMMRATLNSHQDGTYNIILSRDGQLIVHPEFTEQIKEAKGDLSLQNLNDPMLNRLAALVADAERLPTVIDDPAGKNWYGVASIQGPEWYLVTVYPKELVNRRAFDALILPISVGLAVLVITLFFVSLVVRRWIIRPLGYMDEAVTMMSEGQSVCAVPINTDDEFGRLARSFESTSRKLKRREESLEESRREWERTFDAVPEMIAILDADFTLRQVNRTFVEYHNVKQEDCLGKGRTELLPANERMELDAALVRLRDTESAQELTLVAPSLKKTFDTALAPIVDNDGLVVGIVEVSRDMTEQTKLEEQLRHAQKMDAVGQLAGGVAHDFNNLLQVILGYSEALIIDRDADDPDCIELAEIQSAAERAAALTRQLLAFSRRQVMVTRPQDLNDIVHGAAKMIRRLIGEHIELHCIPAAEPVQANVDHNQIEQVVMNLCINARDAMPEGGHLTVELKDVYLDEDAASAREWLKPGHYIQLIVTDTGNGIPLEVQKHIFEPFFTTKEKDKGTGLGLATVYGIVRQHDGEIDVYSEPGQGTTFRIFLPMSTAPTHSAADDAEAPIRGGDECILVAEDDVQIQRLVKRLLQAEGYRVLLAGDGAAAIKLFNAHRDDVDLLLLDVIMPKANGKVVLETIRRVAPNIACIFASGYSENALHSNFKLQKGLHLIEKPYQRKALLQKIREVLDGKSRLS